MGINSFVYLLLSISLVFVFYKKDQKVVKKDKTERPLVVFQKSTMYDLTTDDLKYIVHSKEAKSFKNHEEFYSPLVLSKTNNNKVDKLSSNVLVKHKDDLYLNGDVKYIANDGLIFNTKQLHYNLKTKIALTQTNFVATRDNDRFLGTYLQYDTVNKKVKAKNTNFKIQTEGK